MVAVPPDVAFVVDVMVTLVTVGGGGAAEAVPSASGEARTADTAPIATAADVQRRVKAPALLLKFMRVLS
jgi:hypothetical protein